MLHEPPGAHSVKQHLLTSPNKFLNPVCHIRSSPKMRTPWSECIS